MGIVSDIIEGMKNAEFKPIGIVLGRSAAPALDAGLKHGSAKVEAFMSLSRSKTNEFPGWELIFDDGIENPYSK